MNEILLLKILCILASESGAGRVSTWQMIYESGLTKSQFYSAIRNLIEYGYVIRIMRGWYCPSNWYQSILWEDVEYHGEE